MLLEQNRGNVFPGLVLSPLYENCMLRSQERRATYDAIAGELCDYGLRWQGGEVDARAFRCKTDSLALYSMRYGDEVTISPDIYKDFFLVHLCLKAGIELETDGIITSLREGAVFFSAPQRSIRLRWQEGCEQLILRVPYAAAGIESRRLQRSGALLPHALSPLLVSQLNTLMALSRQGPVDEDWAAHVQSGLARFAAQHLLPAPGEAVGTPDADTRDRLIGFISAHMAHPIQLLDLGRAAGLGRSQLNALTRSAFGCTPMALLRRMRLQAAHRDLEERPEQSLTQLALRYGFDHQGRFSQYYRDEFGTAPRQMRIDLRRGSKATGKNG
ncbi:AraC family transcriptional regulator [Aminobacter sp. BA135]|uniref:AraC family transcriptional regulator n=1 Tax=Aminobacter sp. BA135 TaxID=537596 RepID=UPI003D7A12D4